MPASAASWPARSSTRPGSTPWAAHWQALDASAGCALLRRHATDSRAVGASQQLQHVDATYWPSPCPMARPSWWRPLRAPTNAAVVDRDTLPLKRASVFNQRLDGLKQRHPAYTRAPASADHAIHC